MFKIFFLITIIFCFLLDFAFPAGSVVVPYYYVLLLICLLFFISFRFLPGFTHISPWFLLRSISTEVTSPSVFIGSSKLALMSSSSDSKFTAILPRSFWLNASLLISSRFRLMESSPPDTSKF